MRAPTRRLTAAVMAAAVSTLAVTTGSPPASAGGGSRSIYLDHVGTAFLQENLPPDEAEAGDPTSAEIIDFTPSGRTLVYTDSFTSRLGFVDTTDPAHPEFAGALDLPGDPTSVAVIGAHALVAIVTSDDFDAPTGELLVIHLPSRTVVRTIELGGQPDSIAIAPSGDYAAVVIENERDEDENDGLIPQLPAGWLDVVDLSGGPQDWTVTEVPLTGLADVAPSDPEPEYVDINDDDLAVVSLQENNHLVLVDLPSASVVGDFSAGTADVANVDTVEEEIGPQDNGLISLTGSLSERRREPDTVAWVDDDTFATANEGDYEDENGDEGGSRSFTLFNIDGTVEFESGSGFEHAIVRAGHYPEGRSENKGNEPEGLEVAHHRGRTFLFVAAERANVVGVYEMIAGEPVFRQLLPTGIGPEGLKFRNGVLAVSSEVDGADEGFLARPFITFFEFERRAQASYPYLLSADDDNGLPIPWVAQSGLSGDPHDPDTMWSVSDSFLGQAYLYRIDVSSTPARIVERIPVGATDVVDQTEGDFDLEGVAARPEGGFWLASEGRTNAASSRPNLLVRADDDGTVLSAVELPAALATAAISSGFEGVTVTGTESGADEVVYVAFQRPWTAAGDTSSVVKVGRYEVGTGEWTFAHYPLDSAPGTVGLSELTALPDGRIAVIERDNQLGLEATLKRIYVIDPDSVDFEAYGETLPVLTKALLRDILPDLDAASISVPDKVEGLGVTADGRVYLHTDNDGVDENYGETLFIRLDGIEDAIGG